MVSASACCSTARAASAKRPAAADARARAASSPLTASSSSVDLEACCGTFGDPPPSLPVSVGVGVRLMAAAGARHVGGAGDGSVRYHDGRRAGRGEASPGRRAWRRRLYELLGSPRRQARALLILGQVVDGMRPDRWRAAGVDCVPRERAWRAAVRRADLAWRAAVQRLVVDSVADHTRVGRPALASYVAAGARGLQRLLRGDEVALR
eukprot:scaffold124878_cov63-Phaeocystis_antarctica.AAC.6